MLSANLLYLRVSASIFILVVNSIVLFSWWGSRNTWGDDGRWCDARDTLMERLPPPAAALAACDRAIIRTQNRLKAILNECWCDNFDKHVPPECCVCVCGGGKNEWMRWTGRGWVARERQYTWAIRSEVPMMIVVRSCSHRGQVIVVADEWAIKWL